MNDIDTKLDPTRRVFRGNIEDWLEDDFIGHLFWTYGSAMSGTNIIDMKDDVARLLSGRQVESGFCKELFQTGSRFYHAGSKNSPVHSDTDYDYFGSSQMVGTWAMYLYLTGWAITSSPYFKGVYASYNSSVINLITIKRTEFVPWFEASLKTKSYIKDKIQTSGSRPSKGEYLKVFKKTRGSDEHIDSSSHKEKLEKQFLVLNKLQVTMIKKSGKRSSDLEDMEESVFISNPPIHSHAGVPIAPVSSSAIF
jgi:hypothetical protein